MISKQKQPTAKRWLSKKCEEKDRMKTKTLRRLFSMLAALVMGLSLLTGCSEKNAERTQGEERKNNLKNAFHVEKFIVKYKYILLVDDIYTTGSTAEAVARQLLAAGVEKVFFLSVCIGNGY